MVAEVQCREREQRTFGRDRGADPNSPDRQFRFLLFANRKILALDFIAIDAAQFRGRLQYRGNGIVSGDFPEVYEVRPYPLAVDFGAVSLFTNVALCLRKFLTNCSTSSGKSCRARSMTASVSDALTAPIPDSSSRTSRSSWLRAWRALHLRSRRSDLSAVFNSRAAGMEEMAMRSGERPRTTSM